MSENGDADDIKGPREARKALITNDIIKGEKLTDISLSSRLSDLELFLSQKVIDRLKRSIDGKPVDIDDVTQIPQPHTIKAGTLRDYQLRGV